MITLSTEYKKDGGMYRKEDFRISASLRHVFTIMRDATSYASCTSFMICILMWIFFSL